MFISAVIRKHGNSYRMARKPGRCACLATVAQPGSPFAPREEQSVGVVGFYKGVSKRGVEKIYNKLIQTKGMSQFLFKKKPIWKASVHEEMWGIAVRNDVPAGPALLILAIARQTTEAPNNGKLLERAICEWNMPLWPAVWLTHFYMEASPNKFRPVYMGGHSVVPSGTLNNEAVIRGSRNFLDKVDLKGSPTLKDIRYITAAVKLKGENYNRSFGRMIGRCREGPEGPLRNRGVKELGAEICELMNYPIPAKLR